MASLHSPRAPAGCRQSPDLKLVVSYADFGQGHRDTIYQAGSWLYLGASEQSYIKVRGKVEHLRMLYDRYGRNGQSIPWLRDNVDPRAERVAMAPKLKCVFPLEKRLRRELEEVALPYPKSAAEVTPGDTPGDQPGVGVRVPPGRSTHPAKRQPDGGSEEELEEGAEEVHRGDRS